MFEVPLYTTDWTQPVPETVNVAESKPAIPFTAALSVEAAVATLCPDWTTVNAELAGELLAAIATLANIKSPGSRVKPNWVPATVTA